MRELTLKQQIERIFLIPIKIDRWLDKNCYIRWDVQIAVKSHSGYNAVGKMIKDKRDFYPVSEYKLNGIDMPK